MCAYGALYTPNEATFRFSHCRQTSLSSPLGTCSGETIASAHAILRSMKNKPIEVQHFTLRDEFIELHSLFKVLGIAGSGAEGKVLVASGNVTVDGVLELRKSAKIRAGQLVKLPGTTINVHAPDPADAAAHAERVAAAEIAIKAVNVLKAAKAKVAAETTGGSKTKRVDSPFSAPIRRKRGAAK